MKVVFCGAAFSGKTSNMQYLYKETPGQYRGEMTSITTEHDQTIFFDFLSVTASKYQKVKLRLFTVPGTTYNSTCKLILQGVDAIIFVADSQRSKRKANIEAWEKMCKNLRELGAKHSEIPIALQLNKRDLPDIMPAQQIVEDLGYSQKGIFEATATSGKNVFSTFSWVTSELLESTGFGILRDIKKAAKNKKKELSLHNKRVATLPDEIGELTHLTRLDLSRNDLDTLPAAIGKLINLTELDVSINHLTSLPTEICKLTNLTHFNVKTNGLLEIPKQIIYGLPVEIIEHVFEQEDRKKFISRFSNREVVVITIFFAVEDLASLKYLSQYTIPFLRLWCEKWAIKLIVEKKEMAKNKDLFITLKIKKNKLLHFPLEINCIKTFGKKVEEDLKNIISNNFQDRLKKFWGCQQSIEENYQNSIIEEHCNKFVGKHILLRKLHQYINSDSNKILIIFGQEGLGKSALMAKFYWRLLHYTSLKVYAHFIGISSHSCDLSLLLYKLSSSSLKNTFEKMSLKEQLKELFHLLLNIEEKTVILIDAVERLYGPFFETLQEDLPGNVKLIITFQETQKFALPKKGNQKLRIAKLKQYEIKRIFKQTQKLDYLQTLPKHKNLGHPLYLQLQLQLYRLNEEKNETPIAKKEIKDCFESLLSHLENDYGCLLVESLFCYLYKGTTSQNLADLLLEIDPDEHYKIILQKVRDYVFFQQNSYCLSPLFSKAIEYKYFANSRKIF